MNFEDFLAAPSEKQKTAQLAAGMNFFVSLKQPMQKVAAVGTSQRSAGAIAAVANAGNGGVSQVAEGSGVASATKLPGTSAKADTTTGYQANPSGGRSSQVSTRPGDTVLNTKLPGKPSMGRTTGKGPIRKTASLDELVKEAFIGELFRAGASAGRGAKAAIIDPIQETAKGYTTGVSGFRTPMGRQIFEPGDRGLGKLRNKWHDFKDKFRDPHALDADDQARAAGTYAFGTKGHRARTSDDVARQKGSNFYEAYQRAKKHQGEYGVADIYDKAATTFVNAEGKVTPLSVLDGLHRSGMLRKDSITDAVENSGKYVSKMPEQYRADARKKMLMAGAGAAAGAGVGGFALSKYLSRKKERDDSDS